MDGNGNIDFFKMKYNDILKHLEDKNNQTRKTTLSSLFILTGMRENQTEMQSIMKKVNEEYKEQRMNQKQKDNWINIEEIKEIQNTLSINANSMLNKKKILNENVMIEFLLVSFLPGVFLPPRRSLDYSELKIRNYDVSTDNYYIGNKFYFNKYKTVKTYGMQVVDIPKELNVVLKK